jgi:hypothetical protein
MIPVRIERIECSSVRKGQPERPDQEVVKADPHPTLACEFLHGFCSHGRDRKLPVFGLMIGSFVDISRRCALMSAPSKWGVEFPIGEYSLASCAAEFCSVRRGSTESAQAFGRCEFLKARCALGPRIAFHSQTTGGT